MAQVEKDRVTGPWASTALAEGSFCGHWAVSHPAEDGECVTLPHVTSKHTPQALGSGLIVT